MSEYVLDPTKWIDRYADYLFNYAITRISDNEIAKDIVQETFFAGLKSKNNFKGEASERTWLVSILKRKIIDHYRKINSNKGKAEVKINFNTESETEGDWLEDTIEDRNKNAENVMENEELGLAIHNCLSKLPSKQAQIFRMKTIEGYDTETICNELNITASNLWVIIHRARTSLVGCLKENWF
ncbi:MAG: sigma-70 family RNA polymerase sigma factor [Bacteroidota bacterium]